MATKKTSPIVWAGLAALAFFAFKKSGEGDETPGPGPLSPDSDEITPAPDNENVFALPGDSHAETVDHVINAKTEGISDSQAIEKGKQIAEQTKNAKIVIKKRKGKPVIIRSGTKRIKPTGLKKKKIHYVKRKTKKGNRKPVKKRGLNLNTVNQVRLPGLW